MGRSYREQIVVYCLLFIVYCFFKLRSNEQDGIAYNFLDSEYCPIVIIID